MSKKKKREALLGRRMETLTLLQPTRVKEFSCIGADCPDSCCQGNWSIYVDKDSYYMWKDALEKEDAALLKRVVKTKKDGRTNKEYAMFDKFTVNLEMGSLGGRNYLMNKGYCPVLTEDSRCKLHRDYGEESLCYTCYIYPRLSLRIGDVVHRSLAFSCTESVRLLLDNEEKMSFEYIENKERKWTHNGVDFLNSDNEEIFHNLLSGGIDILQDRKRNVEERFAAFGFIMDRVQSVTQTKEVSAERRIARLKEYSKNMLAESRSFLIEEKVRNLPPTSKLLFAFFHEFLFGERDIRINIDFLSRFGNSLDKDFSLEELDGAYRMKVQPFLENHSYLLENYLVNLFFANHGNTLVYEEFKYLSLHYMSLKFFLSWYALGIEKFDKAGFLLIVQKTAKFFLNDKVLEEMDKHLKEKGWDTITYLLALSCF